MTTPSVERPGMARLEAAVDCFLRFRAGAEAGSVPEVLARHGELRDLLEPMLTETEGEHDPGQGLVGRELGDFRLVREVGRGGMGIVFEARQKSLDRRVAVKVLPVFGALSLTSLVRFKREALTAARLRHAGIVEVLAVGESDGSHWFAMEYVEGQGLAEWAAGLRAREPERTVQRVVEVVAGVAEALEHAHRAGVVHRDVKPSNVLVRGDGVPVLTDFGLAREQGLPSVSQTGEFRGTPYYVAPEQARPGRRGVDARADVFSLGVTLYELLTGRRPFEGDTTERVLHGILVDEPADPRSLDPTLSSDLAAIVLKALEKAPEHRYATAAAFAADLRSFLAYRPVTARHRGRLTRVWRWARREPLRAAFWTTLTAGLITVAGLSTYVLGTSRATAVGQQAIALQRAEELMLDAALARSRQDDELVADCLARALVLAPDDAQVRCETARYYLGRKTEVDARRALAVLDERPELAKVETGLLRVRCSVLRRLGRDAEAEGIEASLGEPVTPYEHALASMAAMKEWARGGDEATRTARAAAERAVLLSERPCAMFYLQLKAAAIAAGEGATERSASDALARFWPGSASSWLHVALAWQSVDPAKAEAACRRSLEIVPDTLLGLSLLAQLADRRGDGETTRTTRARIEQRYPGVDVMQAGVAPHRR
jgi:predicted Ser/Thr protein kinase